MAEPLILLADDDNAIRLVVSRMLEGCGYRVEAVASIADMLESVQLGNAMVLITDVVFPDGDALDQLAAIRQARPDLAVIVMSARSTLLTAVKARESGVFAYLPKPFPLEDLQAAVDAAIARAQPQHAAAAESMVTESGPLIGTSPAMQGVFRSMARLVDTDLTVLITGESGTGKEVVARALHDLGSRKASPFIAVNMAAIPRELIESELFGHERGAFTGADRRHIGMFEQASDGTLFLDEIGDMPSDAQTRLLRVLQDGKFSRIGGRVSITSSARIIAATNKDLGGLMEQGLFREDLYYRLNVVPLALPPLRERREDIPALAEHFIARAGSLGLATKQLSAAAIQQLADHHWAGNVRQLENTVMRLLVLVDGPGIGADDVKLALADTASLAFHEENQLAEAPAAGAIAEMLPLQQLIEHHVLRYYASHGEALPPVGLHGRLLAEMEKPLIVVTLAAVGGNQLRAAAILGINRNTLRKKIRSLKISRDDIEAVAPMLA